MRRGGAQPGLRQTPLRKRGRDLLAPRGGSAPKEIPGCGRHGARRRGGRGSGGQEALRSESLRGTTAEEKGLLINGDSGGHEQREEPPVRVSAGPVELGGDLGVPEGARGIVLFAHGSGSGRHSPRNRLVARTLRRAGLATLLVDLLTAEEERSDLKTGELRFDIGLLAERVLKTTDWLAEYPQTQNLNVGYFGASTGAAAALVAAAERPEAVYAIVSRGGRPDLAGRALSRVRAPTLLVVGEFDAPVLGMNREAMERLQVENELEIVPGATHLFEEPGALRTVARLAADWFVRFLDSPRGS